MKILANERKRLRASSFLAEQKTGASDHPKKLCTKKKTGITRACPDSGVKMKTIVTRIKPLNSSTALAFSVFYKTVPGIIK